MSALGKIISCTPNPNGTISLYNRDGINTYLKPLDGDVYLLKSEIDFGIRVIYDDDPTTILAIDPAGGPFMGIGDIVDNRVICRIVHNKELKGFVVCLQTRK